MARRCFQTNHPRRITPWGAITFSCSPEPRPCTPKQPSRSQTPSPVTQNHLPVPRIRSPVPRIRPPVPQTDHPVTSSKPSCAPTPLPVVIICLPVGKNDIPSQSQDSTTPRCALPSPVTQIFRHSPVHLLPGCPIPRKKPRTGMAATAPQLGKFTLHSQSQPTNSPPQFTPLHQAGQQYTGWHTPCSGPQAHGIC